MSIIDLETRKLAREAARASVRAEREENRKTEREAKEAARKAEREAAREAKEARQQADKEAREAAKKAEDEALAKAAAESKARMRDYFRDTFLREHDIHYVSALNGFVEFYGEGRHLLLKPEQVRMLDYTTLRYAEMYALLVDVLEHEGRTWRNLDASFSPVPTDTLNVLRAARFCPAADGDPHPVFDLLLTNLANGCPDAKAHIERLVLAKWRNPANHTLPALCWHDPVGGSGKSLFVSTVVRTVFGDRMVADNLSMDDVTARFTSQLAGKAVWFVNESVEDKCDDNKLKSILGSRTLWVEPKNLQKFEVSNTAWLIVAGNSPMGSVRVANSSVDRRYSIIRTGGALVARIRTEFGLQDDKAAADWIADEGAALLADPVQVGRWLRVLGERHGAVDRVAAFHGDDYRALVKAQQPFHEALFEAVFRADEFRYVRKPFLYTMYADLCRRLNNGYGLMKNRSFYVHLRTWAEREGVPLAERNAKWNTRSLLGEKRTTTADVIYLDGKAPADGPLDDNDREFGSDDGYGRWSWKVDPA